MTLDVGNCGLRCNVFMSPWKRAVSSVGRERGMDGTVIVEAGCWRWIQC